MMPTRRAVIASSFTLVVPPVVAGRWQDRLVAAAEAQIGQTVTYDPAYAKLDYPSGDVPIERGVCTDVVIRAYRSGLGVDLQRLVHEDMRENFAAYPKIWGMTRTDRSIDHRRVPNLQTYFRRQGAALGRSEDAADYLPGDLVTMTLPGNLPHIAIVSGTLNDDGTRPLVVHNIGSGTRKEDALFAFSLTGHYRYGGQ